MATASQTSSLDTAPADRKTVLRQRAHSALATRYQVKRLLGQGQFGAVYEVFDRSKDQTYAAKVLTHVNDSVRTEVEILKRFTKDGCQPNIVCYRDSFDIADEQGTMFVILTDFIDGIDLDQLRRLNGSHFLPARAARNLLQSLLFALARAHEVGIAHQDLKPKNIMYNVATQQPYIVDFGLAYATVGLPPKDGDEAVGQSGVVAATDRNTGGENAGAPLEVAHCCNGSRLFFSPEKILRCVRRELSRHCTFAMRKQADVWALGLSILDTLFPSTVFANMKSFADVIAKRANQMVDEQYPNIKENERAAYSMLALYNLFSGGQIDIGQYRPDPLVVVPILKSMMVFNPNERATAIEAYINLEQKLASLQSDAV